MTNEKDRYEQDVKRGVDGVWIEEGKRGLIMVYTKQTRKERRWFVVKPKWGMRRKFKGYVTPPPSHK